MSDKEATARVKIDMLLEAAGCVALKQFAP